jgi:small subunit ribosomal protein S8
MFQLSDLIVRIKNAKMAGKSEVVLPFSQTKKDVLEVFKENKYIKDLKVYKEGKFKYLKVELDLENEPITDLQIISKPGRRVYVKLSDLKNIKDKRGIFVVSTPFGVLSNIKAVQKNTGGELICKIW